MNQVRKREYLRVVKVISQMGGLSVGIGMTLETPSLMMISLHLNFCKIRGHKPNTNKNVHRKHQGPDEQT